MLKNSSLSFPISASLLLALALSAPVLAAEKPFPKTPDPAQGMQACPEYGAGFFRMPGSSTCVQVGGRVRGETGIRSNSGKRSDAIDWRTEGSVNLDARDAASGGRVMMRLRGVRGSE